MKRLCFVFVVLLLGLMTCSVANATCTWTGTAGDGLWSNGGNWSDGTTCPPAVWPPASLTETMQIGLNTTVTVDQSWQCGILLLHGASGAGITTNVNVGNGVTLDVRKPTTEIISLSKNGAVGVVTQTGGIVYARRSTTGGLTTVGENGQLRLNNSGAAGSSGTYNLQDGLLEVQVLNKGDKTRAGDFVGTGGTLSVLTTICKFGMQSENIAYGFKLGSSTYAPGGLLRAEATNVGTAASNTSKDDFFANTGTLEFDIGNPSGDKVTQLGQMLVVEDATLKVNDLGVTTSFDWDVWTFTDDAVTLSEGLYGGDFANVILPAGWSYSWVSLIDDARVDTLRIHVPEPATIALLGLGSLIAVRRRKK